MNLEELTSELMAKTAPELPEGVGITLITFDFGEEGQLCYASNAQRPDMYKALRNLLDHWEQGNWTGELN